MRITVLAYLESEEETRGDVVVGQVAKALRANGHEVSICLQGTGHIPQIYESAGRGD